MLELRVFTSFQKRTDKAQHNKELKANSTFNGKDKSIPTFMVKRVNTGYLYRHHNIYTTKETNHVYALFLDNLCMGGDVDQRTVSLRLTVIVFFHLLSVRQVSWRAHYAQARK